MDKEKESKTVQVEYHADGSVTVTHFIGDKAIKPDKQFKTVPKRLAFLLEKFPAFPGNDKTVKEGVNAESGSGKGEPEQQAERKDRK